MPPQLRSAKKSSNGKPSYEIVEWEDDPTKRAQFKAEFEKLKQYYRLLKRVAIEDCAGQYDSLKLTYHNSKDAFDQKDLIETMNTKITQIVEHHSHIDDMLHSHVTTSGIYYTIAPAVATGECWESAVWAIKKDIQDLTECSLSFVDDMTKFYLRIKDTDFPDDWRSCIRGSQPLRHIAQYCPFEFENN
jgi:hypothetical protein